MKRVYQIDEGGADYWWIAESLDEAREAFRNFMREDCGVDENDSPEAEWEFREVPADGVLSIDLDDHRGIREQTAAEWAAEREAGFLAWSE